MVIDLRTSPGLSVYLDDMVRNATSGLDSAPLNARIEVGDGEAVRAELKSRRTYLAPSLDLTQFHVDLGEQSYPRTVLGRFDLVPESGPDVSTWKVARYVGSFTGTAMIAAHLGREAGLTDYHVAVLPADTETGDEPLLTFAIPVPSVEPGSADQTHDRAKAFVDRFNRQAAAMEDQLRGVTEACAAAIDAAVDQAMEKVRLKNELLKRLNSLIKESAAQVDH